MSDMQSSVTLDIVVNGIEQLEAAQKALTALEQAAGKGLNFKADTGSLEKIGSQIKTLSTQFEALGKADFTKQLGDQLGKDLSKQFTQTSKSLQQFGNEWDSMIKNISSSSKIDNAMSDMFAGVGTNLTETLNSMQTIGDSIHLNLTDNVKTETDNMTKQADQAAASIDKIMSSFSKYYTTAQKQTQGISGLGMFSDSSAVKTATDAAKNYQQVMDDLLKASSSGKLDMNKLLGMDGWSEDRIKNIGAELKQYSDEYKTAMNVIKAESSGLNLNKLLGDIGNGNYQKQIDAYGDKIAKLGDSAAKANLTELQQNLQGVYTQMLQSYQAGDWDGFISGAQQANSIVKQLDASLKEAGSGSGEGAMANLSGTFNTTLTALNKIVGYGAIYREMRQAAKEMVSTVNEIDTAMNQLQIVTGAGASEMDTFFESSISQAEELGQSVTDVLDTIQVYSRLGYGLEEASELTEYTSILSNVAAVDIEDATTGLTSVIKGFDLSVDDAEHVSDVLVDIGENYAVSASEILEAFTHSSAAFGATGTTFEEAAAIIAAGNAAVQDASL